MSLLNFQCQLKAPKGQTNKFGGYKYRSCEDILEAVKPLLAVNKCTLVINDEMVEVGGRVYVKATASLTCGDVVSTASAYAREAETKKGMDEAQITGSASSYARKYALNGLFAIDDTKDADATNTHDKPKKRVNKQQVQKYVSLFVDAIDADDALAMKELGDELKDTPEHSEVWGALDSKQKAAVKAALHTLTEK